MIELTNEIDLTVKELAVALDSFTSAEFNTIPFEGSWTAGQVTEHTLKSVSGILMAVNGRTEPVKRDPGAQVETIRSAFLNFNIKMTSPEFILPSNGPHDKDQLKAALLQTMSGLREAAQMLDLTELCLDFEVPVIGSLTRLEFINFAIVHTRRHIRQLQNIHNHFKSVQTV